MIDVEQRVNQVAAYHQWYTSQLDTALLASVARASVRRGLSSSPAETVNRLKMQAAAQLHQMIVDMMQEASSEAILSAMDGERVQITDDETDRIEQLTVAYIDHLYAVVAAQIHSDAQQSIKRYQDFWLNVELSMYRDGLPLPRAILVERERMLAKENVRFDIKGKAWRSTVYLRVETNQALTTLYNAITVYLLGKRDVQTLMVYNPGHPRDGEEFEIIDMERLTPIYFHPNSPALVAKVIY